MKTAEKSERCWQSARASELMRRMFFAELEGQRRLAVMKSPDAKRWRVVRLLDGRLPVIVDSFDIREQAVTLLGQLQENANQRDRRMERPAFELVDGRGEIGL